MQSVSVASWTQSPLGEGAETAPATGAFGQLREPRHPGGGGSFGGGAHRPPGTGTRVRGHVEAMAQGKRRAPPCGPKTILASSYSMWKPVGGAGT